MLTSLRDTALVARFELLRALRTWRAVALTVLYVIALGGSTYIFTRALGFMERRVAETLGVPTTDTPGAMMDRLRESEPLREMVAEMVGDPSLVDPLLQYPIVAIYALWIGLVLLPFVATSAAAESISIDLSTRALRFEALRTGRIELVMGRFVGQCVLTAAAGAIGLLGVFAVTLYGMVVPDPLFLLWGLGVLGLRAWLFGLPFVGIGLAWSQWTASPNWARVLAVSTTAGSWIAFGIARAWRSSDWGWLSDLVLTVLPQGWIRGLWEPTGWLVSGLVLACLALAWLGFGFLRFAGRDL